MVALDNLSTGNEDNLSDVDAELIAGTILDPSILDKALRDADAVVHLAARPSVPRSVADPVASHLTNATGTVEVLEAARRAGNIHVVVASSSSVYGANPKLPKSEDLATVPSSPYGASKLASETYALAYQHSFELPVLAFRFFNVFGPRQAAGHAYAAVVPRFVAAALEGRPLIIHGDGTQSRDFTFVDTVTDVIADAVTRRVVAPGPVNLAFGTRTTIRELAELVGELVGSSIEIRYDEPRVGDVRDSQADSSYLRELFPNIAPVELRHAVQVTIDWFRAAQATR